MIYVLQPARWATRHPEISLMLSTRLIREYLLHSSYLKSKLQRLSGHFPVFIETYDSILVIYNVFHYQVIVMHMKIHILINMI